MAATRFRALSAKQRSAICSKMTSSPTPRPVGNYLADSLRDLGDRQPAIAEVRGVGMMRALAFNEPIGKAVYAACRKNGLLTRPGHDWIGVAPPLVTTKEEVDEIINIIAKSVAEVVAP